MSSNSTGPRRDCFWPLSMQVWRPETRGSCHLAWEFPSAALDIVHRRRKSRFWLSMHFLRQIHCWSHASQEIGALGWQLLSVLPILTWGEGCDNPRAEGVSKEQQWAGEYSRFPMARKDTAEIWKVHRASQMNFFWSLKVGYFLSPRSETQRPNQ